MPPSPFPCRPSPTTETGLRQARVILDPAERRRIVANGADELADAEGLFVPDDSGLLDEVVGLVEWPVPLMGRIDDEFMAVPEEVLITAMRSHQKYISLSDANGKLPPRFVVVANLEADDGGGEIVAGNERVLRRQAVGCAVLLGPGPEDAARRPARCARTDGLSRQARHPLAEGGAAGNPGRGGCGLRPWRRCGRRAPCRAPRQGRLDNGNGIRVPRAAGDDGRPLRAP